MAEQSPLSTVLLAWLLGAIEGLTEFLPISSSGHLIMVGHLLGFTGSRAATFDVVVQLGAILALGVLWWRRLLPLIPCSWEALLPSSERFTAWHMLLGVLPVALVGLFGYKSIKQYLFTPHTLLYGLLAGSLFLILAECLQRKKALQPLDAITHWQALMVGCCQCLALWPGFSRAGATIAAGMLLGIGRATAAEFSFMLALPTMLGATSLELIKSWESLSHHDLPVLAAGFGSAFLVALLTARHSLALLGRLSLLPFALYRCLVAGLLYWLL